MRRGQSILHRPFLQAAITTGLNLFLPPLCGICGEKLYSPGLCVACFQHMRAITDPICIKCGRPLHLSLPDALCGKCLTSPMPLRYLRSAYQYSQASRSLILPFKHADQMQIAATLCPLMMPAFTNLITDKHIVISIPLHWKRLMHRRYNQSAEIARRLCKASARHFDTKALYAPHFLRRHKQTDMLRGKSKNERKAILGKAFHIQDKYKPKIKGRPILLIDDVITTGSTLEEAARTLIEAGSGPVDGLVFARVL